MRHYLRVANMIVAAIFILLAASPACAVDRSVTFGIPGFPVLGLGYERGLSDSSSCCFTIGSSPELGIDLDIGLGMRWYNSNALMNGNYYGLYVHYTDSSDHDCCFYSVQGILGYKRVYDSKLTFDVGVGPACSIENNGDTSFSTWLVLMLGWGW